MIVELGSGQQSLVSVTFVNTVQNVLAVLADQSELQGNFTLSRSHKLRMRAPS